MIRASGARVDDADEAALARLREGEAGAFDDIVERHGPRVYGFATRMCRSAEDARDVFQETFVAAFRSLEAFRGESRLATWLFRIAANACLKMRRRGVAEPARHLSLDELLPGDDAASRRAPPETPEAALDRAVLRDALELALAELPASYRAVVILRDLEGLSSEETAEALGLAVPAVKSRLHRGRLFLRRHLAGHQPAANRGGADGISGA
jgi:RNA polymerase sigma-70 factor (ECF subfamily)